LIDELWGRTVDHQQSIFKRIYPKLGTHGMFEELKDFPAVTRANYSSSADETFAGNYTREGQNAEIYIPHAGGILEYFLYGIQDALRPYFAKSSFPPGYPPPGGVPPGTIQCPLGSGPCSVENLTPFFEDRGGSCGVNEATIASQLCQRESNSGPIARNISCLTAPTGGFAIGLFQVNLAPVVYDLPDGRFETRDIQRCSAFGGPGSTFELGIYDTRDEAKTCRIKQETCTADNNLADLGVSGLSGCNRALKQCIQHYWKADVNRDWAASRACNGSGGGCTCDWSPWAFDPDQYPNACNPIP